MRMMELCCDVCSPQAIKSCDRLDVLKVGKVICRKKRVAVRVVNEELSKTLKEQLVAERDRYLEDNPCFCSVGASFVCPDVTIDELCSQVEYIHTSSDISLFGVRSDLKDIFFKVISSVLSQTVRRTRHREI